MLEAMFGSLYCTCRGLINRSVREEYETHERHEAKWMPQCWANEQALLFREWHQT